MVFNSKKAYKCPSDNGFINNVSLYSSSLPSIKFFDKIDVNNKHIINSNDLIVLPVINIFALFFTIYLSHKLRRLSSYYLNTNTIEVINRLSLA